MSNNYPRYVRPLKNSLFYERSWPTRLKHLGRPRFTHSLQLKLGQYTDAELHRAYAAANEEYELQLKLMQNSGSTVFTETEIEKAATALLRRRKLTAGEFEHDADFHHYANELVPGLEDALDGDPKRERTADEKIKIAAYKALNTAISRKPKLLSSAWDDYIREGGVDATSRANGGRIKQKRWENVFAYIGEHSLDSPTTLDAIHAGLDRYWADRREKGIKVQSIRREWRETLAALRLASDRYRLGWVITPASKRIKADPPKQKTVLSDAELVSLVTTCLVDTKTPEVSAAIVFMVQSGAMVSEITRLNPEEVIADLSAAIPQVAIGKSHNVKVKVEQRRRVVPIVFGKEYLKQHLPKSIKHCSTTTESNMSKRISNKMRAATGNKTLTAHCLRHTLKALSDSVDANQSHVAAIGGWSGGSSVISSAMQQYGAAGLSSSKGFKAVHATSRKVLACVLEVLEAEHGGNVVNITR
jgi:integrase